MCLQVVDVLMRLIIAPATCGDSRPEIIFLQDVHLPTGFFIQVSPRPFQRAFSGDQNNKINCAFNLYISGDENKGVGKETMSKKNIQNHSGSTDD